MALNQQTRMHTSTEKRNDISPKDRFPYFVPNNHIIS
jgi:hypothetical protein